MGEDGPHHGPRVRLVDAGPHAVGRFRDVHPGLRLRGHLVLLLRPIGHVEVGGVHRVERAFEVLEVASVDGVPLGPARAAVVHEDLVAG